jgi:polyphosphate kinase 2 (PPK2 family)
MTAPAIDAIHHAIDPTGLSGDARAAVVVLEGWDTAGKGGIVRRLAWALDPRSFKVLPRRCRRRREGTTCNAFGKIPEPGQIVVFDRSWYERVLPHSRRVLEGNRIVCWAPTLAS